jgi:hypothetical protein
VRESAFSGILSDEIRRWTHNTWASRHRKSIKSRRADDSSLSDSKRLLLDDEVSVWRCDDRKIAPTDQKRWKHVTNDSRLDLSFIIVSDTCRRHHPLCSLSPAPRFAERNNSMCCGTSPKPDFRLGEHLYRQMQHCERIGEQTAQRRRGFSVSFGAVLG